MPVKIDYTQHAVARMVKRQLRREWVERVVAKPEAIEDDEFDADLEHRLGKVPELANRVLRVIVTKSDPMRVVTVHLDRRMKGKL
jgi:hypothetical protein